MSSDNCLRVVGLSYPRIFLKYNNSWFNSQKRFELENLPLGLLSDSGSSDNIGRLRISSDDDTNDRSGDRSKEVSGDVSPSSPG